MRVFVTGGSGFIGSVVVRKLIQEGHDVTCLLRQTSKTNRVEGLSFRKVIGDVRDFQSIENGMSGCDAVIHLASLSSWNDINSPLMDDIVVKGSSNVLTAARNHGVSRVVFVSSAAAINGTTHPTIQNEDSPFTLDLAKYSYCRTKRVAEKMCRDAAAAGLPVVIVNPGEVYGPYDTDKITCGNLIDFAKSYPVLTCQGGTSVVHVDDVASGILSALTKGRSGERYILGSENLTVVELAKLTLSILGKKTPIITIPNGVLTALGKVASTLHIPFPINPNVIPYATLYWFMDNSKAKRELGVSFRSAEDTLRPTIEWLKEVRYI